MDKTAGISMEEETINERINKTSDAVVITCIIVAGVVSVVLIGVVTYMCTRQKASTGAADGSSYPLPDGKSYESSQRSV